MDLKKIKSTDVLFAGVILTLLVMAFVLREVLLPFAIGLFLAYLSNPLIVGLQKKINNRGLATGILLLGILLSLVLGSWFTTHIMSKQVDRLHTAFRIVAENQQGQLDDVSEWIWSHAEQLYGEQALIEAAESDSFQEAIKGLLPFVQSGIDSLSSGLNWVIIGLSAIFYFLVILLDFPKMEADIQRYFKGTNSGILTQAIKDAEAAFSTYFRDRTKIILILIVLYAIGFWIIGIPAAILMAMLIGVMGFIPYVQLLGLIPLSLGCFVLSIENEQSFLLYFGGVILIFAITGILEGLVLTPRIMGKSTGLNPAMLLLSLSVWGYLLGLLGMILAIPLTTLIIKYVNLVLLREDDQEVVEPG